MSDGRATPSQMREYFAEGNTLPKVALSEFKALKETPGSKPGVTAYDEIADGIGNGTFTY